MATTIHNNVTSRKVKVKRNFERTAYTFMRLSGVALLFLAIGHTFLHLIINNVHDLTVGKIALENWSDPIRRASEFLLLIFAMSHGLNGLRNVLEDYVHNKGGVTAIRYGLAAFCIVTLLVVGFAIIAFNPEAAANGVSSIGYGN